MIAVQIGSNRGYDDFTKMIENKQVEKLILVEPLEIHNKSLEECYKHIPNKVIENIIIVDKENSKKSNIFFHPLDGPEHGNNFELASLNENHTINIRNYYDKNEMVCKEIESLSINELFDKYNLTEIDLLFIDTEGYDEKIINSINFEKYKIKELYYENLHCNIYNLRSFLENKNYVIEPNVLLYGWSDYAKLI
jgi:FkbM family methyltransferase